MRSSKKLIDLRTTSKKTITKPPSVPFRTIFKSRNDSALPPNHYEQPHPQKLRSTSKTSRQSESLSSSRPKLTIQKGIKDYVRQMKLKKEEIATPRSQMTDKDVADMRLSRISSSSKMCNPTGFKENNSQYFKLSTLQQMEKRIQNLLAAKLDKLKLHKSGVGLSNWEFLKKENHLEPQIQEIILRLRSNQENEEGIAELSLKLELIEKMMASEAIESELLRERYFGFKNQRCNISSHHNKQLLATASSLNGQQMRTNIYRSEMKASALSKYISTNRQAFSKPARQYYINSKYKQPAYTPNRQILPRSSYSTQFLKYGAMPTFKNRPLNSECIPSHSLAIKASTYQQEFKDKYNLTTNIDFRELDCYKNKFKNPNISFMNNCKKKMLETVSTLKKSTKVPKQTEAPQCKLTKMLSQSTFSDFYKSQQRRNYLGHSASQSELGWMRGEPKNEQLNNLKESLRASYLRG